MATPTVGRLLHALMGKAPHIPALDGFVDSLLSAFENCRPGLTDEMMADRAAVETYFREVYEKETPRLVDTVRVEEPTLTVEAKRELLRRVDELIRKVVVPAYVRLAVPFTRRERNDFYALPEPFHPLERLLLSVAGMAIGAFAVWAPFIPIWEKYWILPFALGGLFVPEARRFLRLTRYESELNTLVGKADSEIERIDRAYLTDGAGLEERSRLEARDAASQGESGGH